MTRSKIFDRHINLQNWYLCQTYILFFGEQTDQQTYQPTHLSTDRKWNIEESSRSLKISDMKKVVNMQYVDKSMFWFGMSTADFFCKTYFRIIIKCTIFFPSIRIHDLISYVFFGSKMPDVNAKPSSSFFVLPTWNKGKWKQILNILKVTPRKVKKNFLNWNVI